MSFFKSLSFFSICLLILGCGTSPKVNIERLPQSSVYEEAEVYTDDIENLDALDILTDGGSDQTDRASTLFDQICREPKNSSLKAGDRVVTFVKNEQDLISGNILETFSQGTFVEVKSDYGVNGRSLYRLKRTNKQVSKSLECSGTGTNRSQSKVYGLYKSSIDGKYYTGHLREVFMNGVVRFVDDRIKEHFSTVDQSLLEITKSKYKLKSVLFASKSKQIKGQIRRVFEKNTFLILSGNTRYLRTLSEVHVAD